jgi:hypothetical protein
MQALAAFAGTISLQASKVRGRQADADSHILHLPWGGAGRLTDSDADSDGSSSPDLLKEQLTLEEDEEVVVAAGQTEVGQSGWVAGMGVAAGGASAAAARQAAEPLASPPGVDTTNSNQQQLPDSHQSQTQQLHPTKAAVAAAAPDTLPSAAATDTEGASTDTKAGNALTCTPTPASATASAPPSATASAAAASLSSLLHSWSLVRISGTSYPGCVCQPLPVGLGQLCRERLQVAAESAQARRLFEAGLASKGGGVRHVQGDGQPVDGAVQAAEKSEKKATASSGSAVAVATPTADAGAGDMGGPGAGAATAAPPAALVTTAAAAENVERRGGLYGGRRGGLYAGVLQGGVLHRVTIPRLADAQLKGLAGRCMSLMMLEPCWQGRRAEIARAILLASTVREGRLGGKGTAKRSSGTTITSEGCSTTSGRIDGGGSSSGRSGGGAGSGNSARCLLECMHAAGALAARQKLWSAGTRFSQQGCEFLTNFFVPGGTNAPPFLAAAAGPKISGGSRTDPATAAAAATTSAGAAGATSTASAAAALLKQQQQQQQLPAGSTGPGPSLRDKLVLDIQNGGGGVRTFVAAPELAAVPNVMWPYLTAGLKSSCMLPREEWRPLLVPGMAAPLPSTAPSAAASGRVVAGSSSAEQKVQDGAGSSSNAGGDGSRGQNASSSSSGAGACGHMESSMFQQQYARAAHQGFAEVGVRIL